MKEIIKDFSGVVLGTIEDNGSEKIVRDFHGVVLGKYSKSDNYTRDYFGKIIAQGDIVSGFLFKFIK